MSRMRIADVNEKVDQNTAVLASNIDIINCNAEHLQRFEKRQKVWNGVLISVAVLTIVLHFCT